MTMQECQGCDDNYVPAGTKLCDSCQAEYDARANARGRKFRPFIPICADRWTDDNPGPMTNAEYLNGYYRECGDN